LISTGHSAADSLSHLVSRADWSSLLDEQLGDVEIATLSSVVQHCGTILRNTA
jgi:hypothetical protein